LLPANQNECWKKKSNQRRKLHITPSKEGVLALILKVGTIIRKHVSAPIPVMIKKLNQV